MLKVFAIEDHDNSIYKCIKYIIYDIIFIYWTAYSALHRVHAQIFILVTILSICWSIIANSNFKIVGIKTSSIKLLSCVQKNDINNLFPPKKSRKKPSALLILNMLVVMITPLPIMLIKTGGKDPALTHVFELKVLNSIGFFFLYTTVVNMYSFNSLMIWITGHGLSLKKYINNILFRSNYYMHQHAPYKHWNTLISKLGKLKIPLLFVVYHVLLFVRQILKFSLDFVQCNIYKKWFIGFLIHVFYIFNGYLLFSLLWYIFNGAKLEALGVWSFFWYPDHRLITECVELSDDTVRLCIDDWEENNEVMAKWLHQTTVFYFIANTIEPYLRMMHHFILMHSIGFIMSIKHFILYFFRQILLKCYLSMVICS